MVRQQALRVARPAFGIAIISPLVLASTVGATDARGTATNPIYGPALDGTLPGNEVIIQSNQENRVSYARAMGPMQFLPGTWARYAADGDGDGIPDPQNLFDATLAAARYLC